MIKQIKKILILSKESPHEWVKYYGYRIAEELAGEGEEVIFVDFRDTDAIGKLSCIDNVSILPKFVISFEGAGFDIHTINGSAWIDMLGSRVYAVFSGHPIDYKESLLSAESWNITPCFTDRGVLSFFNTYFPQYEGAASFVPFAFTGVQQKNYEERSIELLLPMDYIPSRVYERQLDQLSGSLKMIGDRLLKCVMQDASSPMDRKLMEVLQEYRIVLEKDEFLEVMELGRIIFEYKRNFYLENIVKKLLEAGKTITVCGSGWENLDLGDLKGQLQILQEEGVLFEELLNVFGDTKIVILNHVKHLGEISIALISAMANGAVVLSDGTKRGKEVFEGGKEILYYQNNQIEQIPKILEEYLEDMESLKEIAGNGSRKAKKIGNLKEFLSSL